MNEDNSSFSLSSKRASFSSRASKLPQRIVQSFNIRQQQQTTNNYSYSQNKTVSSSSNSSSNSSLSTSDNLPTRISQMIFRQKNSNEEYQNYSPSSPPPSETLPNYPQPQRPKVSNSSLPRSLMGNNENNNEILSTTAAVATAGERVTPYLALPPPEDNFKRSYQEAKTVSNKLQAVTDNGRFLDPPFSPLSSIANNNNRYFSEEPPLPDLAMYSNFTPPLSPMLSIFNGIGLVTPTTSSTTATMLPSKVADSSVAEFADYLMERCSNIKTAVEYYNLSNCTYIQQIELILSDIQFLIDACREPLYSSIEEDIIDLKEQHSYICMRLKGSTNNTRNISTKPEVKEFHNTITSAVRELL
ncbi:hypothetical protein BDF20DRAFT_688663 [Mycotypha africana]|uniref:uncharacterized protein n=1 Tax=Mycotypha africana TaxID=64632 RepID=UPI0023009547|nr:uncharacterized protein BDF20DRAFT_688663 [Mycotypha africana]KAI8971613.1 hypothetical protein BDF20DRAFT_688663 [Mycotypha africana]